MEEESRENFLNNYSEVEMVGSVEEEPFGRVQCGSKMME